MSNTQPTAVEADAYDADVEYFRAHPNQIYDAWNGPGEHRHGDLFAFMNERRLQLGSCGCPSMIKLGKEYRGFTEVFGASGPNEAAIVKAIRSMELPTMQDMCNLEDDNVPQSIIDALPLFAEAQRLGDRLIPGRAKPRVPAAA